MYTDSRIVLNSSYIEGSDSYRGIVIREKAHVIPAQLEFVVNDASSPLLSRSADVIGVTDGSRARR